MALSLQRAKKYLAIPAKAGIQFLLLRE